MSETSIDEGIAFEVWNALTFPSFETTKLRCGPEIPPGWYVDVEDESAMSFDPAFAVANHKEDVYREQQLPRAAATSLPLIAKPPRCEKFVHPKKGRCLRACDTVRCGGIICMDTSLLVNLLDPLAYIYEPIDFPHWSDADKALWKLCNKMIANAQLGVRGGKKMLVDSGIILLLCSVLLHFGDAQLLPTDRVVGSKTAMCGALIQSCVADWWQSQLTEDKVQVANAAIQCMPEQLRLEVEDQTCRRCGFFARVGLTNADTLTRFLCAVGGNGMHVHVPDLVDRVAIFPFARFIEHSCEPNCSVFFLDSPKSHSTVHSKTLKYGLHAVPVSRKSFLPSVAVVCALRPIFPGESLSVSYIPATYWVQSSRARELKDRYGFECECPRCTTEFDLARAFNCPKCPNKEGVICPVGDGHKRNLWECTQCGFHPDEIQLALMIDAEEKILRVKADKSIGLKRLLEDEYVHYSHSHVFHKLDEWSEIAWKHQDADMCLHCLEAMERCVNRVLSPNDPSRALIHEFKGKVAHALGNAHSARYEYFAALQCRLRAGHRFSHWTRKTLFMANEKPHVEFLDSK